MQAEINNDGGGIWANRNCVNHPYCFLSNQKKVQILAFLHICEKKNGIMPSSRKQITEITGEGVISG